MADEVDRANDRIIDEVSWALQKLRQNNAKDAQGSEFCVECEDKIPLERQKLGFKLCVPCAEESERRKSLFVDH